MKMMSKMKTDPIARALELRKSLERENENGEKEFLFVDFTGTLQGKDTSKIIDTLPNSRGNYVYRCKCNDKTIDPLAVDVYGKEYFDVTSKTPAEIVNHIKGVEFDFAEWFRGMEGYDIKRAADFNLPIITQIAGCNFHDGSPTGGCWYCFVDYSSNDGVPGKGKAFMTAKESLEGAKNAREKIKRSYMERAGFDIDPRVIRASGGEPTLALDYVLGMWRELKKQNLDFVGQLDSNLSTGKVVKKFEDEGIYEDNILKKLASFNRTNPIKVLAAIKGVSAENFENSVQSCMTTDDQMASLESLLAAGMDIYPQMYNAEPAALLPYLETMDERIEKFSNKIHVGPIKIYGPTEARLTEYAKANGKEPAQVIAEKKAEWDKNYAKDVEIIENYLMDNYGIHYKEIPRSEIRLRLL